MATETVPVNEEPVRVHAANAIVARHVKWAAAAGLVPLPLVDFAAILGIQVKMVKDLCEFYGVEFRENLGKTAILGLIGSSVPALVIGSVAKVVPWIGALGAIAFTPAVAATMTYAVGSAFVDHFESGGTLLTLRNSRLREAYEQHRSRRHAEEAAARA